jgi:hypothetical protein
MNGVSVIEFNNSIFVFICSYHDNRGPGYWNSNSALYKFNTITNTIELVTLVPTQYAYTNEMFIIDNILYVAVTEYSNNRTRILKFDSSNNSLINIQTISSPVSMKSIFKNINGINMLCVNSNTGIHFYYFDGEKFDNKISEKQVLSKANKNKSPFELNYNGSMLFMGDNFEVLKLLQESYLNKIKMIYIDPPYNT